MQSIRSFCVEKEKMFQTTRLKMVRHLSLALITTWMVASLVNAAPDKPPTDSLTPGPNDRQITLAVRSYLEREHFLRHPIDDEIAHRWFDTFLESLDPMKVYFLQSDIDGFRQKRDQLDDLVKRGDVTFAYEVFDRFLDRVDAQLPVIEKLLDSKLNFEKKENFSILEIKEKNFVSDEIFKKLERKYDKE